MVAAVTEYSADGVLESLRSFLAQCPLLKAGERVTTDLTEEKAGSLAVSPAGEETQTEDVAGNREITQKYWIYRSCLAADEADRKENQDFLEKMAEWIREKNDRMELPALPSWCRAEEMKAGGNRIMESSGGKGRTYRLELTMTYTEKRRE